MVPLLESGNRLSMTATTVVSFGVPREFYLRAYLSWVLFQVYPQVRQAPVIGEILRAVRSGVPLCCAQSVS